MPRTGLVFAHQDHAVADTEGRSLALEELLALDDALRVSGVFRGA